MRLTLYTTRRKVAKSDTRAGFGDDFTILYPRLPTSPNHVHRSRGSHPEYNIPNEASATEWQRLPFLASEFNPVGTPLNDFSRLPEISSSQNVQYLPPIHWLMPAASRFSPVLVRARATSDPAMVAADHSELNLEQNNDISGIEQQGSHAGSTCARFGGLSSQRISSESTQSSPRMNNTTSGAYHVADPYPRISITSLLNLPHSQSQPQKYDQGQNGKIVSSINDYDSTHDRQLQGSPPPSTTFDVPTLHDDFTISSTKIQRSFSTLERRYFLFSSLYHICLEASASYSRSLLPVSRQCHQQRSDERSIQARSHPRRHQSSWIQCGDQLATLMDHISTISTHIWHMATSDVIAPHRAEIEATRVMRDLYTWSELIIKGARGTMFKDMVSQCGNVNSGVDDWAGGVESRVGEAAKKLCKWMRDEKATRECDCVIGELMDLAKVDV